MMPPDKAAARRSAGNAKRLQKVFDKRRFKEGVVPTGDVRELASPAAKGTKYPDKVAKVTASTDVLTDGRHNAKIGSHVAVGKLRGAPIMTLTLEERATCPSSCDLWRECYGNGMPWSTRWKPGRALETKLMQEVAALMVLHPILLIRLHILGDFYSLDYLKVWALLLDEYEGLHVFGFTAHQTETPLGASISKLRGVYPDRFMIRHSGRTGDWGSFTIDFPTELKQLGDAIVCPEQRDSMNGKGKDGSYCANCAVCWSCDKPIVFVRH